MIVSGTQDILSLSISGTASNELTSSHINSQLLHSAIITSLFGFPLLLHEFQLNSF
ncbi:MAG: hypothetical protein ACOZBL_00380 [Patescibacteria group bacterium]